MSLPTLQSFCDGRRILFLDKNGALRRLGLRAGTVERLAPVVVHPDAYVKRFDAVLYTNPESSVNRGIVAMAMREGVDTVYCLDGVYEYANVCFNRRIRKERPFGTFVAAEYAAVRTVAEAMYFSCLGKRPLQI